MSPLSQECIIERMRHLMALRHLSQRALASLLGLDPSNLSKVLTGKLPVTEGLVNRIVADLGVSKAWLKEGRGLPFDKEAHVRDITLTAPLRPAPAHPAPGRQGLPVYDIDATAGCRSLEQIFTQAKPVGLVDIPELPQDSFLMKVRGDSMSPRIANGSYVAVRPLRDARHIFWGQIYVVELDEFRMIKYVRRNPDPALVTLHSQNPAYDDMDVPREDIRSLYVVEAILNYEVY